MRRLGFGHILSTWFILLKLVKYYSDIFSVLIRQKCGKTKQMAPTSGLVAYYSAVITTTYFVLLALFLRRQKS